MRTNTHAFVSVKRTIAALNRVAGTWRKRCRSIACRSFVRDANAHRMTRPNFPAFRVLVDVCVCDSRTLFRWCSSFDRCVDRDGGVRSSCCVVVC